MVGITRTTVDHEQIWDWVESNGGSPACLRSTGGAGDPGVLCFDFPGGAGTDELQHISWVDWFDRFDSEYLLLLYQREQAGGEDSTFFKLVRR